MGTKIKGSSISARLKYIEKKYGQEQLESMLSVLNEEDQKKLKGIIIPSSSYDLSLNARLDSAIASIISPTNPVQVFRDLGRASAEANLTNIHKTFIKGDSPHNVLKKYPSVRNVYYSDGTGHYEKTGEREGYLKLVGADFTLEDDESTAGYFERGIELMGGKNVEVKVIRGHKQCEYLFNWQ